MLNNKITKAPEKIYVANNLFPTYVDWDGSPVNTKRIDNDDVEYIRKDAFVEKAYEYLSYHLDTNKIDVNYKFEFIENFRNYMKEE